MNNLSRRRFLQSAAVAGTGVLFIPNFISCAPSTKLRYAVIGVGGRGEASWSRIPEDQLVACLLYTSPSPRDRTRSRMPSSA